MMHLYELTLSHMLILADVDLTKPLLNLVPNVQNYLQILPSQEED